MSRRIRSFDPVAAEDARILILGSMPGERSLAAAEYYAHPRNAFWRIMQEVAGVDPAASYEDRLRSLQQHGISLWDVLHSCDRQGSLDAAIEKGSVKVNDFAAFFRSHPQIRVVLLNGGTAQRYFKRFVLPTIAKGKIEHIGMPSTSPAHAAMSLERKIGAWREAISRFT
jgi:TDG/mug DNA glycosylase family protein